MNIDEGEKKFKKRWNTWTKEEQIEFVKALDGTEPNYPVYLNLACTHWEHVPDAYEQAIGIPLKAKMRASKR